ncbi:hypothetical protein KC19_1G039500 [Ceratodon purpureus]|uniref:Uncharacterized protein n=1 Tax=Ceratodon purpureus TaxID=3225 RepID=A0A8T0J478_CERPU|nr:hypothetical protein KC19_1G039500 [Ceratodon purpureus]
MGGRKLRGVAAKFQLGECARPGEEARQSQSDVTRSGRLITKLELVHDVKEHLSLQQKHCQRFVKDSSWNHSFTTSTSA